MMADAALDCDAVRDLAPLFVTGALEAAEAAAVREHLRTCPDPHAELLALGEAATALLAAVEPVEPPPGLRVRLLAAAEADLREGRHPAGSRTAAAAGAGGAAAAPGAARAAGGAPEATAAVPVARIDIERARRRSRWTTLLAAAAVVAVIALGGWNLSLRGDLDAARAYQAGVDAALALAARPASVTALIAGGDGTVTGFGVIGEDGSVRLVLRGLAPTSGSQVYAAWAIAGQSTPVAIGEFTVGASGTAAAAAKAPTAQPGTVLALTLEPSRGATTPTPPIVASGVTQGPPT